MVLGAIVGAAKVGERVGVAVGVVLWYGCSKSAHGSSVGDTAGAGDGSVLEAVGA
jgi:hypothetical protein